jgi:VIT1/CCC1 family predicted Fe2+/Mn2+ transporter
MSAVESWREEMQSAWLYREVARAETDTTKRQLFESLADAAEDQAGIWRRQFESEGAAAASFHPAPRARLIAWFIHRLGPRPLLPVLAAMKVRGVSVYSAAMPGHAMPTSVAQVGGRHRGVGGGNLRAAVFGVNDGLVSNTSLIMGVAGATGDAGFILTSGIAGLLAGALSMAAGEYVSMRSQREMYEYQIGLEREEFEKYPVEETEELALIYHARGMALDEARTVARKMMQDPGHALDALAREELGLNPDDLGSPWGAALFSFLAFTAGAVIPLVPFLWKFGSAPLVYAAVAAGTALFVVGAVLSLFTGRRALWSGARMLLIGGASGLATFGIGKLLGVALA